MCLPLHRKTFAGKEFRDQGPAVKGNRPTRTTTSGIVSMSWSRHAAAWCRAS